MSVERDPLLPATAAEEEELERLAGKFGHAGGHSLAAPTLAPDEARRLTDEVKADAAALWAKLLRLYEGGAHAALGYSSWADYCRDEFDMGKSNAYRVLDAARVVASLPESPVGERPSERVARELAPLRDEPERLREAWAEAVEQHGAEPTAAQVREHVEPRRQRPAARASGAADEWAVPRELFDALNGEFGFDLDACCAPSAEASRCERYYTADDALARKWDGAVWVHVPAGPGVGRWLRKASAVVEAAVVVCLAPAETGAAWFWEAAALAEVRLLRGEVPFRDGASGRRRAAAVFVFGPGRPRGVALWDGWRS